jgi:hypothetical protein
MRIDNSQTKVIFEFTPAEYILMYDNHEMEWTLNERIDRSEKGKDDDIGSPRLHLTEMEAEACKKAGFSYVIG